MWKVKVSQETKLHVIKTDSPARPEQFDEHAVSNRVLPGVNITRSLTCSTRYPVLLPAEHELPIQRVKDQIEVTKINSVPESRSSTNPRLGSPSVY